MSPVKVALVIDVACVRTKSSADSISNGAPASGRVAVAINPSGSPVLKEKGVSAAAATAGSKQIRATEIASSRLSSTLIFLPQRGPLARMDGP
jgi:hypothetical protein